MRNGAPESGVSWCRYPLLGLRAWSADADRFVVWDESSRTIEGVRGLCHLGMWYEARGSRSRSCIGMVGPEVVHATFPWPAATWVSERSWEPRLLWSMAHS